MPPDDKETKLLKQKLDKMQADATRQNTAARNALRKFQELLNKINRAQQAVAPLVSKAARIKDMDDKEKEALIAAARRLDSMGVLSASEREFRELIKETPDPDEIKKVEAVKKEAQDNDHKALIKAATDLLKSCKELSDAARAVRVAITEYDNFSLPVQQLTTDIALRR